MEHTISDTIEENTLLEDGEQAVVIQTDAIDNLEIGAQAIMIQMDANDNEVEEVYSQELDFINQPLQQNQQQTELDKLRGQVEANVVELRDEIIIQSNKSDSFNKAMSEKIEKMNKRMIEYQQDMIDSDRLLQEKLNAIDQEAVKQRMMLKTVSEKVDKS